MGWSYRKSVHLGPFRVNLSKSGIGYSVGAKDFRVGVNARGRRYESVTVPGTGLTYRSGSSKSAEPRGRLLPRRFPAGRLFRFGNLRARFLTLK